MENEEKKESAWELLKFSVIAVAIVIPIRIFIAQPFIVSGNSMFPTFLDGDYLVVDQLSYRLNEPKRFDVIVFRYPNDKKKFFIKRIIGLPGETVEVSGSSVKIKNPAHPDGFVLEQPYVENQSSNNDYLELKEDEYFVMGDNRLASSDSRYWGAVNKNLIMGRALLRLLPIKKIDLFPGYYHQLDQNESR